MMQISIFDYDWDCPYCNAKINSTVNYPIKYKEIISCPFCDKSSTIEGVDKSPKMRVLKIKEAKDEDNN